MGNGTAKTIRHIGEFGISTYTLSDAIKRCERDEDVVKYLNSLQSFYDDGENVFVHGWVAGRYIHSINEHTFQYENESEWEKARWLNGMDEWHRGNRVPNRTVFCGHWHCSWGWSHIDNKYKEFPQRTHEDFSKSFRPYIKDGICAIDACTAYSYKVNCVVVERREQDECKTH